MKKVYLCPKCGLLFGSVRLTDGRVPYHEFTYPLQGVCPGVGERPNEFGPTGWPVQAAEAKARK